MNEIKTARKQEIYEQAVTTSRSAETLAKKHGFENLEDLVAMLPEGARVIDVGAGTSNLGKEACRLRQDITWLNFDYSYSNPDIMTEVSAGSPPNLQLIAGDATKLQELYLPESFDAVFSYWMMPHLSLASDKPAQDAAKGMLSLAKNGAYVSVGPKVGKQKGKLPRFRGGEAVHFVKDGSMNINGLAQELVSRTKLKGRAILMQKFSNEVMTPFFGTSIYAKRPEGKKTPHMYDPYRGEHISFLNPRAMIVVAGLAKAATQHLIDTRKAKK